MPTSPFDARKGFLLLAVGASIVCGIAGYEAGYNEITGQAIDSKPNKADTGLSGTSVPVLVTRQGSPARFRRITNWHWAASLFCLGVAVVGFTCYRKLGDCV
jgi:hypothetical protein